MFHPSQLTQQITVAAGSVLVGILCSLCCTCYYWALTDCHSPLVEVLSFFCWALLPYYLCDGFKWSGIVALVAAGFVMDLYVIGNPSFAQSAQSATTTLTNDHISHVRRKQYIFGKLGHMSKIMRSHVGLCA